MNDEETVTYLRGQVVRLLKTSGKAGAHRDRLIAGIRFLISEAAASSDPSHSQSENHPGCLLDAVEKLQALLDGKLV